MSIEQPEQFKTGKLYYVRSIFDHKNLSNKILMFLSFKVAHKTLTFGTTYAIKFLNKNGKPIEIQFHNFYFTEITK